MQDSKAAADISIQHYFQLVRRRLWVAINVFAVTATIGIAASFMTPSVYQTTARLLLAVQTAPGNIDAAAMLNLIQPDPVGTQVKLMQSSAFRGEVYSKAQVDPTQAPLIMVGQEADTNLVDVTVEGSDPRALANIANAMAGTAVKSEQDTLNKKMAAVRVFLDSERKRALDNLNMAEKNLAAYWRAHGNLSLSNKQILLNRELADTQTQLRTSQFSMTRLKDRLAEAQRRWQTLPDTIVKRIKEPNLAYEEAKSKLDRLTKQRKELLRTYTDVSSGVKALDKQIADQNDILNGMPPKNTREEAEPNPAKTALASDISQMQLRLTEMQDNEAVLSQNLKLLNPNGLESGAQESQELELTREVDTDTKEYMAFSSHLQDLRLLERAKPASGRVVEQAQAPTVPIRPNRGFLIAASVLAAMVLSLGMVFLLEYLDDHLKRPQELERVTGLSILGYIPTVQEEDTLPIANLERDFILTERLRVLRSDIQFAAVDTPFTTLLVTSGLDREGKSFIAANLAVIFAMEGRRVVLIDTDMRKPALHRRFGVPRSPGLCDLLAGSGSLDTCLKKTALPNLSLITAGESELNPAELIGSKSLDSVLEKIRPYCDMIILDSPPCLVVTDAALLAAKSDATLLVVDFPRSKKYILQETISVLARARARLLGVVVNRADGMGPGAYYRYSHYYTEDRTVQSAKNGKNGKNGAGNGTRPHSAEVPALPDDQAVVRSVADPAKPEARPIDREET